MSIEGRTIASVDGGQITFTDGTRLVYESDYDPEGIEVYYLGGGDYGLVHLTPEQLAEREERRAEAQRLRDEQIARRNALIAEKRAELSPEEFKAWMDTQPWTSAGLNSIIKAAWTDLDKELFAPSPLFDRLNKETP